MIWQHVQKNGSGIAVLLLFIMAMAFVPAKQQTSPQEMLIWRKGAVAAIRYQQYKLIRVPGLGDRLYNLYNDPGETTDLSAIESTIHQMLAAKLEAWEQDNMKPLWTKGHVLDTVTLVIHDDLLYNRKVTVSNPQELEIYRTAQLQSAKK